MEAQKFTTTARSWQKNAASGMGVGTEFKAAGKAMIITKVSEPYREGRELLVDTWVVEAAEVAKGKS